MADITPKGEPGPEGLGQTERDSRPPPAPEPPVSQSTLHTPAYGEVDLSTCDREPIHVPGAIQPHGVLVALDDELRAVMVSANVGELLDVTAETALGRPLTELLGPVAAELADRFSRPESTEPLVVTLAGREVDVRRHRSGDRWIVELEPIDPDTARMTYDVTRGAMARLARTGSVVELAGALAGEVRAQLGFDRVMVYRFDDEWNGEVIAEERRSDLNSFLGLHYPASDIPAQARRLYTVNWSRLIADIGYQPVPLHPIFDPSTGAPLDLSHATLRSVSPIHIEYLSNMGVGASMSISLIVDGELWGLVACHHYSGPHRPSHDARAAAEFLGQVASQFVADRERADGRARALDAQTVLARMTARITAAPGWPIGNLLDDHDFLSIVGASGAALLIDGTIHRRGDVPFDDLTLQRIAEVVDDPDHYVTHTDRLPTLLPDLASSTSVAGVLRVGSAPDRWLLWLRPERERVVDWGGDPRNKELAAAEGPDVRLSPRKSFEKWREVVRGRSLPWAPWKLEIAETLGSHMVNLLLNSSKDQIAMAEAMQRSVVLDRPPAVRDAEVAARYEPASSYQLGGDWWDVFELDDGSLAVVVGDVAGHGVDAASAMTQVRMALRAYLFEGHRPAACLDRLDHLMVRLLDHQVATVLVGVVDPARTRVELASAGHPPPMKVVDGQAEEVAVSVRPLLGVGAGEAIATTIDLSPDASLLFYTDGLIERRGADLTALTDRLRRLAAETHGPGSLDDWLDRLLAAHAEGDRRPVAADDTTVLAIRLAPRPAGTTDSRSR
nr:SpoIIE family protein phosphatase [Nocardioides sp. MAH-18]